MSKLLNASDLILARWILPISEAAQENACLVVNNKTIVGVIQQSEYDLLPEQLKKARTRDFGESIVMPGLINLHTHLDYSNLKHFDNYSHFFQWIRSLIANSWQWDSQQWLDSALNGAKEIMQSGTSMLVDASYSGAAAKAVAVSGLRGIVGLELFGINEDDAENVFADWQKKYQQFIDDSPPEVKDAISQGRLKITIAPHTPYSVCPALIRKALAWTEERQVPLLIHIAESEAECQWIAADNKDLDKFLEEAFRGKLANLSWRGHGRSPVQHLHHYDLLRSNILAAHLVQLNESDIATLASHKVSAVHCPRSNSRLRNGIAPLTKLIKAGISLGFGTDSAASTDDLNLLAEARFAWDLHRAVDREFNESAERAVYHLTLGAAAAVSMDNEIGSLESGKKADYAVFSIGHLPSIAKQHPFECLIYGGAKLNTLVVDGQVLDTGSRA